MVSRISLLPVELIELISEALERNDIQNLRLVSTELYKKTSSYFARVHFAKIRTSLSLESLQVVQRISEREQIRHHVRVLEITSVWGIHGLGFSWPRDAQGYLTAPLPGLELLQQLLVDRLTNCRSFYFRNCDNIREPLERPFKEIRRDETKRLVLSDAVAAIFSIIAAGGLEVECFNLAVHSSIQGALEDQTLDIVIIRCPEFKTAWAQLQELRLQHLITSWAADWALELASSAQDLRKLALNFSWGGGGWFIGRLIENFNSVGSLWPNLRELKLDTMFISKELLLRFLGCFHEGLRVLILSFSWMMKPGSWTDVFRAMGDTLPNLESISVTHLTDTERASTGILYDTLANDSVVPGSQGRKFTFWKIQWQDVERAIGATYRGPEMHAALEMLATSAAEPPI